jgi:hypothetical protein
MGHGNKKRNIGATVRRCFWLFARGMFNLVIVAAFAGIVACALWLFHDGYRWQISAATLLLFMIAAFVDGGSLREGIVLSLCMPFLVLGGFIGLQGYLALFTISWFEAIFNSKGSGPLGLIVFVVVPAVATAIGAAWTMDRFFPREVSNDVSSREGGEKQLPASATAALSSGESSPSPQ